MNKETRNSRFERKSRRKTAPSSSTSSPRRRQEPNSAPKTPRRSKGLRAHSAVSKPKSPQNKGNSGSARLGGAQWIWGLHAVKALLANPKRTVHDLLVTENALARLSLPSGCPPPKIVIPALLERQLPPGAVHQGMAVRAAPLEWPDMHTLSTTDPDTNGLIIVLDQITDPHNVGAMLRLASAFGAKALIMQDRKAPPLGGALAKVAVGCLETVPVCLVTNITNTLETLKASGWMVTGLAGDTPLTLSEALKDAAHTVIVMGAEGPGLRPRVQNACDQLARIPMLSSPVPGQAESLNVATAAAIALYEVRRN